MQVLSRCTEGRGYGNPIKYTHKGSRGKKEDARRQDDERDLATIDSSWHSAHHRDVSEMHKAIRDVPPNKGGLDT